MTNLRVKTIIVIILLTLIAGSGFYFGSKRSTLKQPQNSSPATQNDMGHVNAVLENTDANEPLPEPSSGTTDNTDNTAAKTTPEDAANTPDNDTSGGQEYQAERFVIAIGQNSVDAVTKSLFEQSFIDNEATFKSKIKPGILALVAGGYKLYKNMNEAQVAAVLQSAPYMKWIIVPEGLRKEETAELMASELGWTETQKKDWITADTAIKPEYTEGVYFPDTYLIPTDESPAKIAERMRARFNEAFASYLPEFNKQNIKWTTGLTFASIVQREAKNAADMPLIAGILWNRLEQGMALGADATLQYARGNTGNGWWANATAADKSIDSPYNTYTNKGLPPHPICNPGIKAIEATLNSQTTDCLYYLHSNDGATHCAATYEQHLQNIESYLKNTD